MPGVADEFTISTNGIIYSNTIHMYMCMVLVGTHDEFTISSKSLFTEVQGTCTWWVYKTCVHYTLWIQGGGLVGSKQFVEEISCV